METFFMNTKNSKTSEPYRFKYNLIDKLDLKNPNKNMALASLSIYYTWKNVKSIFNNNKFNISAPTWNDTFELMIQCRKQAILNFRDLRNIRNVNMNYKSKPTLDMKYDTSL